MMSAESCIELLNRYVGYPKLVQHCMFIILQLKPKMLPPQKAIRAVENECKFEETD